MEPTLQEKLKAVAEFCGWEEMTHTRSKNWILKNTDIDGTYAIKEASVAQMKFHTDYNWLMEAWRKWKTLDRPNNLRNGYIFENHCSIIGTTILDQTVEKAFDELASAIVWYNSLKT